MSEVHNALFCRCCREYLPIHEQEEHRKFHAEPPYMGTYKFIDFTEIFLTLFIIKFQFQVKKFALKMVNPL